jgi:hypothetical protein
VCVQATDPSAMHGTEPLHATCRAPLVRATVLSYTSTHGSFYNASESNATVGKGWVRDPIDADPLGGGMHAVVFVEPATGRGVIAFRGTDLDGTQLSGAADACADALLFGASAHPVF